MRHDVNHHTSYQWLSHVLGEGVTLTAPTLLLPEIGGPISRLASELDARRALGFVERLLSLRLVPLRYELGRLSARLAAQFRLRGADSVYVALAYQNDFILVSWDEEQRERAAAAVMVRTPADLLASQT
jgi:predicted nucleic acid-binding protein